VSENQDDLGDDTAEESSSNAKGADHGSGKKKNRGNAPPAASAAADSPAAPPANAANGVAPASAPVRRVAEDSPRAKELQARAAANAGSIRKKIGQVIKCPGCEVVAYAKEKIYDKPKDDPTRKAIGRYIRCTNEDCQYKKNTGRQWSRKVPLDKAILNDDEDYGVMSPRQLEHVLPKGD
jgi:hypothetical protein